MRISVQRLSKSYAGVPALRDVTLDIEPGQAVALLGANGAGKTTLLRCLAGVAGPDAGEILYDGEPFRRDRLDQRRRFAFLPDSSAPFSNLTVLQYMGMALRLYEAVRPGVEDRVVELLREFDILALAEARLGSLSRGQAYKAVLAAVLAVDPEVWLLDEPFASGMDPRGLSAFGAHARAAVKRGRTILFSTQLLQVAERTADRLCIIHKGEIVVFDTVEQVRRRAAGSADPLERVFQQLHEADV